ncbi:baseplate J/gp47 family protein [Clostridium sp. CCUG 7971]|uniref:baseplate J/gp47 family protein n=1 Tax=Clostridium sp. CCUG 7971 TaxID=2811414 RepID=UPI001ABA43C7|nr:baseplate J/gp47 family protein [Clostridium sp. CCUG 7971]MBO3444008.1 baseplate J/gp47 family protein [Clostridium sp. CCUG 7971]
MFDDLTFEYFLESMLERVPNSFDKREGSIIYNALAPAAAEMAELVILLSIFYDESYVDTASYNYLVRKCKERGITPNDATNAIVKGEFNIDVAIGSRFSLDNLNYVVTEKVSTGVFKLKCEDTGPIFNLGKLIPIEYIEGLETAQLIEILINGEYDEDEESLRKRYYDSLESEAFGGNISDYKEKVNKLQDIGGVKVYPVWNGGGTVKLVLINSSYDTPSTELINQTQEKIDPIQNQGKGLGVAPIGHIVTVVGVEKISVNINTNITYQDGWNFEELKSSIEQTIDDYFKELNKTWSDKENIIVRVSQIETRLLDLEGVLDIENTTINGNASNLTIDKDSIVTRGDIVG